MGMSDNIILAKINNLVMRIARMEQKVTTTTGPQGLPGLSGSVYEHIQVLASSSWVVNHNLGFRPNVALLTSGGVTFLGEINHSSVNQFTVSINTAISGIARCN